MSSNPAKSTIKTSNPARTLEQLQGGKPEFDQTSNATPLQSDKKQKPTVHQLRLVNLNGISESFGYPSEGSDSVGAEPTGDTHVKADVTFIQPRRRREVEVPINEPIKKSLLLEPSRVPDSEPIADPSVNTALRESLQQTEELTKLLADREQEITQRDVTHHVEVWNFQRETQKTQKQLAQKARQLDEREAQLMTMQVELFQLHHQLIDSQLATREIIENLNQNQHSTATVKSLTFELNKRFDHVEKKWMAVVNRFADVADQIAERISERKNLQSKTSA